MKKHNIILAVLACAAAVSLSACSKTKVPTVDELFAQPFGSAAVTSGDLDVKLTTSVTTQSGTTDVDLNVNSRFQNTVRYTSGTEAGTTGGTAYNNKLESYLVADGGGVYQLYNLNSQTGRWEVSSSNSSDTIDTSTLLDLNKAIFSDLAVQDFKKGDSEYVVRGTISYADLKTLLGSMTNKVPSTTDLGVLPATLRFDTTSKQLNSFMVLIEAPVGDINKFEFSYKVNNLNSTTVTLPDDVKNNAVPAGTSSSGSSTIALENMEQVPDGYIGVSVSTNMYNDLKELGVDYIESKDGTMIYVSADIMTDYYANHTDLKPSGMTVIDEPDDIPEVTDSTDVSNESIETSEVDSTGENTVSTSGSEEPLESSASSGLSEISNLIPVGDGRVHIDPSNEENILEEMFLIYEDLHWDDPEIGRVITWLEFMLYGSTEDEIIASVENFCSVINSSTSEDDTNDRYMALAYVVDLGIVTKERCVALGVDASKLDTCLAKIK